MTRYTFKLAEDNEITFEIAADSDTSREPAGRPAPAWARLDRHRCEPCTLPAGSRPSCPAALALLPLVDAFGGRISYDKVQVRAHAHGVDFSATMGLQAAIRSVMGVTLAQSSCPVLRRLRPMAHYHLPFASEPHATFRYLGMYLIAQHLRHREGLSADWDLNGLVELVGQVHQVNTALARRLREAAHGDAAINSLIFLDVVAHFVEADIEQCTRQLKPLFTAYFEDQADS